VLTIVNKNSHETAAMPKTDLKKIQNTLAVKRARRSAAEQFALVDHQIRQVCLGRLASLLCPYCSSRVVLGVEKLCCVRMGEATDAVLRRMEPHDRLEIGIERGVLTDYQSPPPSIADAVGVAMRRGASAFVQ
jgi:hypothetical protein